jgi:hypothetical protein
MEATRKQIEVTKEVRKEIKAAFKCSNMAIWRALSFTLDTPLSLRIRKFAKQKGGVLLLLTPAVETIHDKDGYMRQYFENGAMIEADKNTGRVQVMDKNGKVCRDVEHCSIEQLYVEQAFAERL